MRSLPLLCLAFALLLPAAAAESGALRSALTHHASFDRGFDADFSRGDPKLYFSGGPKETPLGPGEHIQLTPGAGRFGGALRVARKNPVRPYFNQPGVLDYRAGSWSGSVSVWLRISPDEDLEPGYCDPVQIVGGDSKRGFMFLEWSKDETPRLFRYAIRPRLELWNPQNVDWAKLTDAQRPMVQVARAPFARTRWTHVVFTWDRLNEGKAGSGRLYLDGEPQGAITGWQLDLGWDPAQVRLVLAAAYVGDFDDLAVFNRELTPAEVRTVMALPAGIASLR